MTKAIEHNVPILFINPRGTSTPCPRCGAKLSYNHRLVIRRSCGFTADRDVRRNEYLLQGIKIPSPTL